MTTQRPNLPFLHVRRVGLALTLCFLMPLSGKPADETNSVTTPAEPASARDTVSSYLQLQAQLHATQMALEQNRREIEAFSAKHSEALTARLEQIEQALAAQRAREAESPLSGNRLLLLVAGAFGGMGFIALLLTGYLQWRTVNRLTSLSTVLADTTRLALPPVTGASAGDVSSARLMGALNRLEHRLLELENPTPLGSVTQSSSTVAGRGVESPEATTGAGDSNRTAILLAKGQSLISLGQPDSAMGCFDEILTHHPDHPEALVKKGLALEHQQKPEDALRHYDRAIAVDGSFTQAHLQKAALCNRLGQYDEAVACYEQVLRVREKQLGV